MNRKLLLIKGALYATYSYSSQYYQRPILINTFWELLVLRCWPLISHWRKQNCRLLNCSSQREVKGMAKQTQPNAGTVQPVLCTQTDVGFVTCRCNLISSEEQGRTDPFCPHQVQKLIPVKGPTITKWNTTANELNECFFIRVKATVKLPLSTYDTVLPLKTSPSTIWKWI